MLTSLATLRNICVFFAAFVLTSCSLNGGECIGAYDFGTGNSLFIESRPSSLLKDVPATNQVAPWTATNFTVKGVPYQRNIPNSINPGILRIYIDGGWNPWGYSLNQKECSMVTCERFYTDSVISYGPNLTQCEKVTRGLNGSSIPCTLKNGLGLYGLIALNPSDNPNDPAYFNGNYPANRFRTFHVGANEIQNDDGKSFVEITSSQKCDMEGNCEVDRTPEGEPYIVGGALYFKIYDNYYLDNARGQGYSIKITSGFSSEKGIIQETVEKIYTSVLRVAASMAKKTEEDLKLTSIIRALAVLYIATTGLLFAIGLIKTNVGELTVRIFKISLILIMISPNSFAFFYNNFFILFTQGADSVAQIIIQTSLYYDDSSLSRFAIDTNANALTVYDQFYLLFTKVELHKKILSLISLLWRWEMHFIYFFLIYLGMFFIILAIFKSIVMYVTSLIFIGVLIAIFPIFLVMILFQITSQYFKQWLDLLISNSIMIIMVSGTIAMMALLILGKLEQLLMFKVCYKEIFSIPFTGYTINAYSPPDINAMKSALTFEKYIVFLITAILFNAFIGTIPQMVDSISGAALQPVNTAFGRMWGATSAPVNMLKSNIADPILGFGLRAAGKGIALPFVAATRFARSQSTTINSIATGLEQAGEGIKNATPEFIRNAVPTSIGDAYNKVTDVSSKIETEFGLHEQNKDKLTNVELSNVKDAAKSVRNEARKAKDWFNR